MKKPIRNFPQEAPYGPWPLLLPASEDRQYQPILETPEERQKRLKRDAQMLLLLDLKAAAIKGVILGLGIFGLSETILGYFSFWMQDWHWLLAVGGGILLVILIGWNLALIILALITFLAGIIQVMLSPLFLPLLFLCVVVGIGARIFFELWPLQTP